jgi:ferric-dicitrate binding protein FerR (iron transport regulator)
MNRQEFFDLIDKWTKGEATEQELKALMNYYYSFRGTPEWDELEMGNRLQLEAEMEEQLLANIRQTPFKEAPMRRLWWPRIAAASVLLAMVLGLSIYFIYLKRPAITRKELAVNAAPGQHRQLKLPDSTTVWLSPASSLRYLADQADTGVITVYLEGEAFFDVQQHAGRPFVVMAGGLTTTVLGTSFNIQAYDNQPGVGVTVVTGKVAVKRTAVPATLSGKTAIPLSPSQRAVFSKQTQNIHVTSHVDTEQLLLRRTGILKYKGAALQEVTNTLANYYKVSIRIEGPTDDCFYFGDFDIQKGLDKALQQLCLTLNATLVKKDAASYIIKKGRC